MISHDWKTDLEYRAMLAQSGVLVMASQEEAEHIRQLAQDDLLFNQLAKAHDRLLSENGELHRAAVKRRMSETCWFAGAVVTGIGIGFCIHMLLGVL